MTKAAYFDSCCLVKCYLDEGGSQATIRTALKFDRIHCSVEGRVEIVSSFRRAWRERRLSGTGFTAVMDQLRRDVSAEVVEWIPVSSSLIESASELLGAMPRGVVLHAGDAIHLAAAKVSGFDDVWSTDRQMLAAAPHFGLTGRDPTA